MSEQEQNTRRVGLRPRWFRAILRRRLLVILLLLVQIAFLIYALRSEYKAVEIIQIALRVVSVGVAFYIVQKKDKAANKVSWLAMVLVFPIFGGAFYLIYHFQTSTSRFQKRLDMTEEEEE